MYHSQGQHQAKMALELEMGKCSRYGPTSMHMLHGASQEHRVLWDDGKTMRDLNQGEVGNIHAMA